MESKSNIMVIVPAYNEKDCLVNVVTSLLRNHYFNIVVIDDGCTPPLKEEICHLPVTYIRHRSNLGQGAALQTGFDYAIKNNADIVITFDADGQHDAADLPALLQPVINNETDISLGSRFLAVNNSIPPFRRIILKQARFINFIFSGLLLSDAHNGLRALNRIALKKISITENRMAHASEMLFEIKKHKLRFMEVAVHIDYSTSIKKRGQSEWDSIKILFDLVLHKLFK